LTSRKHFVYGCFPFTMYKVGRIGNPSHKSSSDRKGAVMIQVIAATFEDGVFKPDEQLSLSPHTRVRLVVETMDECAETTRRQQAWDAIEQLWRQSTFDSQGKRLNRDQLHERH
jgi:predicted DNA-binding antitoxin AbrB/MazE fold protein